MDTLLKVLLWALVGLNALDTGITAICVSLGLAREGNPLMAALLEYSVFWFVFLKLLLVGAGCALIWKLRTYVHRAPLLVTTGVLVAFYLTIVSIWVYHIVVDFT